MSADDGRFYIYKDGRKFLVEPIEPRRMNNAGWGDVNPATGKVEGSYGEKHKGSIDIDESIITEENGFKNIQMLGVGESPASAIERLLNQQ